MSEKAAPRAWVLDAADFDIPSTVEELSHVIHLNRDILDFIEASGVMRDAKFIIVGPKGSGKTLLLKAKRVALEEANKRYYFIPRDAPQDKSFGASPLLLLTKSARGGQVLQLSFWKSMWVASITLAVIKETEPHLLSNLNDRFVKSVSNIKFPITPLDIFTRLVDLSDDNYRRHIGEILNNIGPYYRSVSRDTAIFIDSVDDYLALSEAEGDSIIEVKFKRAIWVLIQMGLAEAILDLRVMNTHVKVFASLRKEALMRGFAISPNAQQIEGIALDIRYSKTELKDIFEKNIRLMSKSKLVSPYAQDPFESLLGNSNIFMTHTYTGRIEHFFDLFLGTALGDREI